MREHLVQLRHLHIAVAAQRTNEIMRVLTVLSAIFMPLTFIAGIYGMNFAPEKSPWNMPELHWRYGYVTVLGVMGVLAVALLGVFWRRGWIGSRAPEAVERGSAPGGTPPSGSTEDAAPVGRRSE